MKNAKLIILRLGSGFFALIALMTGARKLYVGVSGELGEAATNLAGSPALASLDNDLRFLAMCWLVVGMALMVGAIIPRRKPDFILIGLIVVILGGFARLYGFAEYGPLPDAYAPIAIEFFVGIPLLALFISWRKEQNEAPLPNEPSLEATTGS